MSPARRLETILLATDGSAHARLARRAAAGLAEDGDVAVHLVQAWTMAQLVYAFPGYVYAPDLPGLLEAEARASLDAERRTLEAEGVSVAGVHVAEGRASDAIVEAADEVSADLVLIGARGLGTLKRLVLGSVSEAVVHQSHRPVLIVRGDHDSWPPHQVVAGIDGSLEAEAAAFLAARIARRYRVAMTLVGAIPVLSEGDVALSATSLELFTSELDELLRRFGERLADELGTAPRTRVVIGEPAAMILDAAESTGEAALVAVGSRGLGRARRLLLGSVSTKVLHGGKGTVLVVPPAAQTPGSAEERSGDAGRA